MDERVTIDVRGELLVGDTFRHDGWIWEAVERLAASENGFVAQSDTWAFVCDPIRSVPENHGAG